MVGIRVDSREFAQLSLNILLTVTGIAILIALSVNRIWIQITIVNFVLLHANVLFELGLFQAWRFRHDALGLGRVADAHSVEAVRRLRFNHMPRILLSRGKLLPLKM